MRKLFYIFFIIFNIYGQESITDAVDTPPAQMSGRTFDLPTETISKISPSGRVFALSRTSDSFFKGDFMTILINNEPVARCLAAKVGNSISGIKIMKLYNIDLWKVAQVGTTVQILRGDDSSLFAENKSNENGEDNSDISDNQDLFDEAAIIEGKLDIKEDGKRVLKTDNIVSANYNMVEGIDTSGSPTRYNQLGLAWAYQVDDNIWGELSYGQSVINDFPDTGFDTKLTNITLRIKYTFKAPLYSYLLPYIGYQIKSASSPGAGIEDPDNPVDASILQRDLDRLEALEKNSLIIGVTVLKRLVPGWFVKLDLGTDVISGGFALEF